MESPSQEVASREDSRGMPVLSDSLKELAATRAARAGGKAGSPVALAASSLPVASLPVELSIEEEGNNEPRKRKRSDSNEPCC